MALQGQGGYYRAGANFVVPTSNVISGAFLISRNVSEIPTGGFEFICGDQDNTPANQHFMLRLQRVSPTSVCLSLTSYGVDGKVHHFKDNTNLNDGLQLVGFTLNMADYTNAVLFYNGTSHTVATDQSSWTDGANASANPISLLTRGDNTLQFRGVLHHGCLWDAAISEANFQAMGGSSTGTNYLYANPLQYNLGNVITYFDCLDNSSTFIEQITGFTYTKTNTVLTNTSPGRIELGYCKRPTGDTYLQQASPTSDVGGGTSLIVGHAAAANTARRRPLLRFPNLITSGVAKSAALGYRRLRLYASAAAGDAVTTGKLCRVTRLTWVEGTSSSDGAAYNFWDDFTTQTAWTGGVDGAAAGTGGDYTTTGSDAFDKLNATGFAAGFNLYTATNVITSCMAAGGAPELLMRFDTEQAGAAALQTNTFNSREGTNTPILVVTYYLGSGGGNPGRLNPLIFH